MAWDDRIFRYCERGSDPAFWAEPLNAITNCAFIFAAILAARDLIGQPRRSSMLAEWGLTGLIFAMGIGSFLFHTYATRWASYADTIPIGAFMFAYLIYALRRFAGFGWVTIALSMAAFVAALQYAGSVQCRTGWLRETEAASGPCLNGTAGYIPAFAALILFGARLWLSRHPAWRLIGGAAAVFLLSMTFRTLDWEVCDRLTLQGHALGTHFLWHLLNAATLYVLARAAIRHGGSQQ